MNKHLLQYSFVLVSLLGLAGLMKYYDRSQTRTILPVASYVALTVILTFYTRRYLSIVEPVLLVYASILVGSVPGQLGKLLSPRREVGL
jgi:hypothetical protein